MSGFKLVKTENFKRKVVVLTPTEKTDVDRREEFVAVFKQLPEAELQRISDEIEDRIMNVADTLDLVLVAVEGVGDENGNPLPADEALAGIKGHTWASRAAFKAYFAALSKDIDRKNSKRSR